MRLCGQGSNHVSEDQASRTCAWFRAGTGLLRSNRALAGGDHRGRDHRRRRHGKDKVSRVLNLVTMRDNRERAGQATFELIACVDGRGFRVRREDMRKILLATRGKVFTLATLDRLIEHTRLREFVPRPS